MLAIFSTSPRSHAATNSFISAADLSSSVSCSWSIVTCSAWGTSAIRCSWSAMVSKPRIRFCSRLLSARSFRSMPLAGSYPSFSIGTISSVAETNHGCIGSSIASPGSPMPLATVSSSATSSFESLVESGWSMSIPNCSASGAMAAVSSAFAISRYNSSLASSAAFSLGLSHWTFGFITCTDPSRYSVPCTPFTCHQAGFAAAGVSPGFAAAPSAATAAALPAPAGAACWVTPIPRPHPHTANIAATRASFFILTPPSGTLPYESIRFHPFGCR